MPISNPSYFPEQKGNGSVIGVTAGQAATGANCFLGGPNAGEHSTADGLIILGANSGTAGIDDVNLDGTIIIGVASAPSLTGATPFIVAGVSPANVIIGTENCPLRAAIDTTVMVGSGNFTVGASDAANTSACVVVGNSNFISATALGNFTDVIVIGHGNFQLGSFGSAQTAHLVMLGTGNGNGVSNASAATGVIIGNGINFGVQLADTVLIGEAIDIGIALGIGKNTVVGSVAAVVNGVTGLNTLLGASTVAYGDFNTVIGARAAVSTATTFGGCVIIGALATDTVAGNGTFLIAAAQSAAGGGSDVLALEFGNFLTGNLVLGNSSEGTNRDLNGTNTVKLLNGTKTGNPIGGGYFYVSAGALHWVGSSGTDTVVAPA